MNTFLLKYLNSVKMFEAPNDQGSKPPEKPKIEVDSVDNRNKEKVSLNPDENKDESEEEGEEEEEEVNANPDETEEEKTARIAQEKEERRQNRVQKRIDKLTATVGAKDNEILELKKQLAEKPKEGLTEEEIERRASAIADAKVRDKLAEDERKAFEKTADTLIKSANKVDKDFEKNINEVAKDTGVLMPKYMVEILSELDNENGHEVLVLLSKDDDLYEEVCGLSERRMTKRLEKMSEELKTKNKNGTQQQQRRERIPDPIEPVDGNRNRGNNLPSKPTQNMDEYVRIRSQQTEALRKQGKNVW